MWFKNLIEFLTVAWKWVALAAAALALMMTFRACNRADRAEAELERVKEAVELKAKDHLIAERVNSEILKAALTAPLKAEISRLEKDLGKKPKIVVVERIVTKPAPAEGLPRPQPLPGEPCPDCMFASGDTGQIRVDSAHVETEKGNQVVALSAECWRLTPAPETRILAGTASAPLSHVATLTPPPKPGWGAGVGGGFSTSGPVLSAVVQSPPFLTEHLSALGIATAGPGTFAGQVGLLWR